MNKRALLSFCFLAMFAITSSAAKADPPAALQIAAAQFPMPRSTDTEKEWSRYRFNYAGRYESGYAVFALPPGVALTASMQALHEQLYSDADAQGRPMWFGGSHDDVLKILIEVLLRQDKFAATEKMLDDWARGGERTADGKWKLDNFFIGLDALFKSHWDDEYQRIERWKAQRPESAWAAIAEATYWSSFAWQARGEGYSDTVDRTGWTLFSERSRKSEDALLRSKAYAASNPLWGAAYLGLAAGLNWSIDRQLKLFHELTRVNKDFYSYYFIMTKFASPKWKGSWALVDSIAREAETLTADTDGASLYTRVYWAAAQYNSETDFFRETSIEWTHMKRGFDDLMSRYPHSVWNANNYASFACAAGDAETFIRMRRLIRNNIQIDAWPRSRALDECDAKFPEWKTEGPPTPMQAPMQLKPVFRPPNHVGPK